MHQKLGHNQEKLGHKEEKLGHTQEKLGHHNFKIIQNRKLFGNKIVRPLKVRTKTAFKKKLGHVKFGLVTIHRSGS